jgi:hypothetical protein
MTPEEVQYRQLTIVRAQAYAQLFGGKPDAFFAAINLRERPAVRTSSMSSSTR